MSADRNLLFGILALQLNFVTRDQLVEGINKWVLDKKKTLGELFVACQAMDADQFQLLDALVNKHIEKHGGDAEQSLQQLSSVDTDAVRLISEVQDAEVKGTISRVRLETFDPYATQGSKQSPQRSSARFRIIRPHAKGGLGEVFIAQDTELFREVALKEIQGRWADNTDSRERFLREAQITGNLEHPGIVPVYGLGQYNNGRPFYAMRFIRGESLKEAIEAFHAKYKSSLIEGEAGLELRKLLRRLVDVCNAMAYAHSRGVLHRDLKPGNIILGKYGETLVVDWGLAKAQGHAESTDTSLGLVKPVVDSSATPTQSGSAMGTPAYMSPEQAAGRLEELNESTDIYSLGASLFHLLTGQLPIVGTTPAEMIRKAEAGMIRKPREIRSDVPKALEAICLKAMSKSVAERYPTSADLASDIEKWLADEPVTAFVEPLSHRARRWVRQHAVLAATSVLGSLLTVVFLCVFMIFLQQSNATIRERNESLQVAKASAELSRDQARTIASIMSSVVKQFDPGGNLNTTSVVELLNEAERVLSEAGSNGDELAVEIYAPMANALLNFGDYLDATRVLEKLLAAKTRLGSNPVDLNRTKLELGIALMKCPKPAEAIAVFKEILSSQPVGAAEQSFETTVVRVYLGDALRFGGDFDAARIELVSAMNALRKSQHPETLKLLAVCENNLALVYYELNRLSEAAELYALATEHSILVGGHEFEIAVGKVNHAVCLEKLGRYSEAKDLLLEAIIPVQRVNPNHRVAWTITQYVGPLYFKLGEYENAIAWLKPYLEQLDIDGQVKTESTFDCQVMLAQSFARLKNAELPMLVESLLTDMLQPNELSVELKCEKLDALGRTLLDSSEWILAEKVFRSLVELRDRLDSKNWEAHEAQSLLSEALGRQKKYVEAEQVLSKALAKVNSDLDNIALDDAKRVVSILDKAIWLARSQDKMSGVEELTKARDKVKSKLETSKSQ